MVKASIFFLLTMGFLTGSDNQEHSNKIVWPNGRAIAVSLSYDDALNSQLDNAIPALDSLNLKATFYILQKSPTMKDRMEEWRSTAQSGHELGNHSLYHPCRGSLPNREWVAPHLDLDKYTLAQIVEEVTTANTFLKALDGKDERTFTPPCLDKMAGGENYLGKVNDLFVAIKGQGIETGFSTLLAPDGFTGEGLIEYIQNIPEGVSLINILFHGVGGDYLSVSSEAHSKLLNFLANNKETYYVDTYLNIMKYTRDHEDVKK